LIQIAVAKAAISSSRASSDCRSLVHPDRLTRPTEKIKELQRLSTEIISVKKDLEPRADATSINLELGLCAFIEGFDV
jgi:hypothetical protein